MSCLMFFAGNYTIWMVMGGQDLEFRMFYNGENLVFKFLILSYRHRHQDVF